MCSLRPQGFHDPRSTTGWLSFLQLQHEPRVQWFAAQGPCHATEAYLLGQAAIPPSSPGYFYAGSWAPQTEKQSPKQMYANCRLQGRLTHLLNRSSPQTSPTTLPTPQPPTPGAASRRKELKFHFKEAIPQAMAQHPLPCLTFQHTGPGKRSGFQGRVGRGGGHQGNAPALSLLWL